MRYHIVPRRLLRTAAMCVSFGLSFLVFNSSARAQSQDNWTWTAQRKLAVPDQTANRRCITITKSGFYVGKETGGKVTLIEQYTSDGTFTKNWSSAFTNVGGLASDADGNIYVSDFGAKKVIVFNAQGTELRRWDGPAGLRTNDFCHGIAVDGNGSVYVTDWDNFCVLKYSSTGSLLLKFGSKGDLPNQFRDGPSGVAVTPEGTLLATDLGGDWYHLKTFSLEGELLSRGNKWGGDNAPYLACPVSSDGLIFTANGGGSKWALSGFYSSSWNWDRRPTDIHFVDNGSHVRGAAFDLSGNFWACRDKNVECMERRYRRDTFPTTKKPAPLPVVSKVSQVAGSKIVDIDFRVLDGDSAVVTTALVAFIDGTRSWQNLVIPKTFTSGVAGVLGSGVSSGASLRVSWDASKDMPGKNFANLAFEALAKDDRPEIGIQFVTLPLDASNAQPLKISKWQVQEDDLWDLWLWLLAKGDPNVAISGNTVTLTAAGQAYIKDALLPLSGANAPTVAHNGSASTKQGRAFAYKLMNCRPVTAAEVTRANAGRFNLTAVDNNSVVSLAP